MFMFIGVVVYIEGYLNVYRCSCLYWRIFLFMFI